MSGSAPGRWTLFVPLAYFAATRLRPDPARLGLVVMAEWAPVLLVLTLLQGWTPAVALGAFLPAYLAFITVYEVGYLANDLLAVREARGRSRLGSEPPGARWVVPAVGVRLVLFAGFTDLLEAWHASVWWGFYVLLAVAFVGHNLLLHPGLRTVTFIHLAAARFLAPLILFVSPGTALLLLGGAGPAWILPRTLAYLASKNVLVLPGRTVPSFKVALQTALLLPAGLVALLARSWVPLALAAWFLGVWVGAWALGLGRGRAGGTGEDDPR